MVEIDSTIRSNTLGLSDGTATVTLSHLKDKTSGDGTALTKDLVKDNYLDLVDLVITNLNAMRAEYGSTQNQIESSMRNMITATTNIAAAESVIRDVDYATESAYFNKQNIMSNANSYAQSQANMRPNDVLSFLN